MKMAVGQGTMYIVFYNIYLYVRLGWFLTTITYVTVVKGSSGPQNQSLYGLPSYRLQKITEMGIKFQVCNNNRSLICSVTFVKIYKLELNFCRENNSKLHMKV